MPEMNDVTTGSTIASQWGNDIRDRSVQRYADAAERTTEHPTPAGGDLSYLADTGDVARYHSGWKNIVPTGVVLPFAATTPPPGFLLAQGQAVSRTTYADLFALIGTTYGVGDGSTTFNLPDLQQRLPLGKAASGTGSTLGETGGAIDHAHSGPSHTHTNPNVNSNGDHSHTNPETASDDDVGQGSVTPPGNGLVSQRAHTHSQGDTGVDGSHVHSQGNTGAAGTGNTGTNNPPFIALNFIIKT